MFLLVHTGIKKSYYLHKPPWKIRENHRESDGGGGGWRGNLGRNQQLLVTMTSQAAEVNLAF